RGWFVVVAIVLGLWGLALFVTDAGLSSLMWVWPGDPLTSQLIGVMLLALAAGALLGLRSAAVGRVMLVTMLVYGLGVGTATASVHVGGAPLRAAYLVVFAVIALASAALLVASPLSHRNGRDRRSASARAG